MSRLGDLDRSRSDVSPWQVLHLAEHGQETVQAVLLLAVVALLLLSTKWLWSAAPIRGTGGLQGAVAALVQDALNGRLSEGDTPPAAGRGEDRPKRVYGTPGQSNAPRAGTRRPTRREQVPESLPQAAQTTVEETAEAMGEKALQKLEDAALQAKSKVQGWQQTVREAELPYKYNLNNPANTAAEKAAIAERYVRARKGLTQAESELFEAEERLLARGNFFRQTTATVNAILAVDDLLEAERRSKELAAQGRYEEAWKARMGGLGRFLADWATTPLKKLPLGFAIALNVAASEAGQALGQEVGAATFSPANRLAHWLASHSWWPANRQPRIPLGTPANTAP